MPKLNLENLLTQARAVLAASERATPGPWDKRESGHCGLAGLVYQVRPPQFTAYGAMDEASADFIVLTRNAAPDLARAVLVLERAVKLAGRMADIDHAEDENICDWCETREDCQGNCTPTKVKYLLELAAKKIEEESNG